eukprot:TRINITY_DN9923_c0_g1_i1.p1 TRINITY_DN9923_c0_g1~~TRINITY_DN9923_c0_g1_i1.p1  ORF type:complete len:723 (+),score=150.88 TRINITY_DN9923_c0_g1_i1:89-2257(+)
MSTRPAVLPAEPHGAASGEPPEGWLQDALVGSVPARVAVPADVQKIVRQMCNIRDDAFLPHFYLYQEVDKISTKGKRQRRAVFATSGFLGVVELGKGVKRILPLCDIAAVEAERVQLGKAGNEVRAVLRQHPRELREPELVLSIVPSPDNHPADPAAALGNLVRLARARPGNGTVPLSAASGPIRGAQGDATGKPGVGSADASGSKSDTGHRLCQWVRDGSAGGSGRAGAQQQPEQVLVVRELQMGQDAGAQHETDPLQDGGDIPVSPDTAASPVLPAAVAAQRAAAAAAAPPPLQEPEEVELGVLTAPQRRGIAVRLQGQWEDVGICFLRSAAGAVFIHGTYSAAERAGIPTPCELVAFNGRAVRSGDQLRAAESEWRATGHLSCELTIIPGAKLQLSPEQRHAAAEELRQAKARAKGAPPQEPPRQPTLPSHLAGNAVVSPVPPATPVPVPAASPGVPLTAPPPHAPPAGNWQPQLHQPWQPLQQQARQHPAAARPPPPPQPSPATVAAQQLAEAAQHSRVPVRAAALFSRSSGGDSGEPHWSQEWAMPPPPQWRGFSRCLPGCWEAGEHNHRRASELPGSPPTPMDQRELAAPLRRYRFRSAPPRQGARGATRPWSKVVAALCTGPSTSVAGWTEGEELPSPSPPSSQQRQQQLSPQHSHPPRGPWGAGPGAAPAPDPPPHGSLARRLSPRRSASPAAPRRHISPAAAGAAAAAAWRRN